MDSLRVFDPGFGKNSVLCASWHHSKNHSGSRKAIESFPEVTFWSCVYQVSSRLLSLLGTGIQMVLIQGQLWFSSIYSQILAQTFTLSLCLSTITLIKDLLSLIKYFWVFWLAILIWRGICLIVYELIRMLKILKLQSRGGKDESICTLQLECTALSSILFSFTFLLY